MKKRKNPNDTTFRNINALKKKLKLLKEWVEILSLNNNKLVMLYKKLLKKVEKLEKKK